MNKLNSIFAIMLVLLSSVASAYVDVTYTFNQNDVRVDAYDILNADGSSVSAFSGELLDGQTTTDGSLTVRYPDSLATSYGYGIYFTSSGFLPLEAIATWNTAGDDGEATQNVHYNFQQGQNCRAVIDQFTVTNTAQPNVPVIINMEAGLDASLQSAFHLTDNNLDYVPAHLKDDFYSADIQVALNIYQGTTLVDTQTRDLTVFASDSVPVSFTWTPTVAGGYRAEITTTIVDDQCASSQTGQSAKDFTVDDSLPSNECYTILNGLKAMPTIGVIDEQVVVSYDKISNHANTAGSLSAIPTMATWTVTGPGFSQSDSMTLPANSGNLYPTSQSFAFIPTSTGMYSISVSGSGASSACSGLNNPVEVISMNMEVKDEPRYSATFVLSDGTTAQKVSGAVINLDGTYLVSDSMGQAMFGDLMPGTYAYVITHPNYKTLSGMITVTDFDMMIFLALEPGTGVITPIPTPTPDGDATPADEDRFGVFIDSIRIGDAFSQTQNSEVPFYISFSNNGDATLRHVKAAIVIQDLALRASVGPFDLGQGDELTQKLFLPLDGTVRPGVYPVRITLHGDDVNRVVYREIEVIQ